MGEGFPDLDGVLCSEEFEAWWGGIRHSVSSVVQKLSRTNPVDDVPTPHRVVELKLQLSC